MKKAILLVLVVVLVFSMSSVATAEEARYNHEMANAVWATPEMVEESRAEIEQMIEDGRQFLENNMTRRATRKTLIIPLLTQNDSRWAYKLFPCGHTTYLASGCAMTSYAMIARYHGNANAETPVTFAHKYNTAYGDPCNQTATRAATIIGENMTPGMNPTRAELEAVCVSAINQGKPVMIRTNSYGSHFFVAYGYYDTSSGSVTIFIRDPDSRIGRTSLGEYYNAGDSVLHFAVIG